MNLTLKEKLFFLSISFDVCSSSVTILRSLPPFKTINEQKPKQKALYQLPAPASRASK
jgi:hypothetical protein